MFRHVSSLLIAATVLFAPHGALAQAPAQLPVQGFLTDPDGQVVDGIRDLRLSLYDDEEQGELLFEEDITGVPVSAGHFVVHMGAVSGALDHSVFRDHENVWLQVTVNTDVIAPRFRLASVAYAGFAQYAGTAQRSADSDTLGGIGPEGYVRGDQVCPENQVATGLNPDGTLRCEAGEVAVAHNADALGGVPASAYVRGNQACPGGQIVRGLNTNGTLLCAVADADFATRAGDSDRLGGLPPAGYVQSGQVCPDGQIVTGSNPDGTLRCVAGQVDFAQKAGDAESLGGVAADSYVRSNQRCPAGQVATGLNEDGTLACAVPNAGTLGGIGPTGFVRSNQRCPAGSVLSGFSASGAPECSSLATYINANCTLYFGWRDSCDGCTSGPAKVGSVSGDSCTNLAGGNDSCISVDLGSDRGVRMLGINTDGDVNDDDKFYIGIRCK